MAVLTPARIPVTTALGLQVTHAALDIDQRSAVDNALYYLGIEDGYTINDGGTREAWFRLLHSSAVARFIGLHLPEGEELAQCAVCRVIAPSSSIREDEGVWRCTAPDPDGTTCYSIYLGSL